MCDFNRARRTILPADRLRWRFGVRRCTAALISTPPSVAHRLGLFTVACALGATASAASPSAKPKSTASHESEPIHLAGKLAQRIDDPEFRNRFTLSLVEFQIAGGHLKAAADLATTIVDYRRGLALAKVAAAFGRKATPAQTVRLIEQAEAQDKFPHPWQAEAVRAEVAIAWAAAAREKEAETVANQLTDGAARIRARSGIALEKARRGEPHDEAAFQFTKPTQLAPERLEAVRALLEIITSKLTGPRADREVANALTPLCLQAEAILKESRAPAGEEYLDLGLLWRRIGNFEKSAELLGGALRQMQPGVELHEWRDGYFARLVRVYAEAGDQPAVEKMLAAARQGILGLHRFFQPPALSQLAEAELAVGQRELAEKTWLEAAQIAGDNPNPASQYLGWAQIAFSIARADRPMTPPLRELLTGRLAESPGKLSKREN